MLSEKTMQANKVLSGSCSDNRRSSCAKVLLPVRTLKCFSHLQKTDFVSYCVDTLPKGGMEVAELVNKSDQRRGKMWKKKKQIRSETSGKGNDLKRP